MLPGRRSARAEDHEINRDDPRRRRTDALQMNEPTQPPLAPDSAVPQPWRDEVRQRLGDAERVLAALEVDLDERLHFERGLVIVTDRRIATRPPGETTWRDWPLRDDLRLRKRDHAGVGTLELLDARRRLGHWCFTLGEEAAAQRLIEALELAQLSHDSGADAPMPPSRCPRCQAVLPTGRVGSGTLDTWSRMSKMRLAPAAAFCVIDTIRLIESSRR